MKEEDMLKYVLFMGLFIFTVTAQAQLFQQVANGGAIDWQNQKMNATGIGSPNPNVPLAAQRAGAIRSAKLDALRQLLETVKGMNLNSETTVRNAMVENDVIQSHVSGVVKNFKVTDTRYLSDGSVEVDVEIPVTGILTDALLPTVMGGSQPGTINYPNGSSVLANTTYTGLVIDARGLGLHPAMAPKVLDENGNEVYGTGYVSREYAVQIGVVGYEKDLNRAKKNDRVTDNPAVVKALKVSGTNKTDVVISNSDAARINAATKNLNFMQQCKVMLILD